MANNLEYIIINILITYQTGEKSITLHYSQAIFDKLKNYKDHLLDLRLIRENFESTM